MKSFKAEARLMRALVLAAVTAAASAACAQETEKRLLYVASPGIRNYVEWGGKGVLVYDIDAGHKFLRRIPSPFPDPGNAVENIKGICASAATKKLYVTTIRRMACLDLVTERTLWMREYEGGCDRMAITPDGAFLYLPSLEKDHWFVVEGAGGNIVRRLDFATKGAHNTVCPPGGRGVYLAGLRSNILHVADPAKHEVVKEVGPFTAPIRPFTINRAETLAYVNVNGLLGFEIGDLQSGRRLHRVEVEGFKQGPVKRHGCPSHGVGLTPDEKEVWVVDAHNQRVHVFDNTRMPPRYVSSIELAVDQPGWITFTIKGDFAYPSTGEVIDPKARKIVAWLRDEAGRQVQSEKVVEIDWAGGIPIRNGDQFGVGRAGP
jgi:DNA-binding beta-propeller fold protein YncE